MSAPPFPVQNSETVDSPSALLPGNAWARALRDRFDLIESADPESIERCTVLSQILDALEQGHLRVAEPMHPGGWSVHGWVKRALIISGITGTITAQPGPVPGTEVSTLGWREQRSADTRVPAGSHLRRGCYLAPGVSVMPPSTIQVGAWLGAGVRVDPHVLIGSCAQICERVVVGCGTMIGGVLLPEAALPIVLEAGVLVGGNCGLYGSLWIGQQATVRPGTILNAAAGVFDSTTGEWLRPGGDGTLRIPAGAEIGMALPPSQLAPNGVQQIAPTIFGYADAANTV